MKKRPSLLLRQPLFGDYAESGYKSIPGLGKPRSLSVVNNITSIVHSWAGDTNVEGMVNAGYRS